MPLLYRLLVLFLGLLGYAVFLATLAYLIGFVSGFGAPTNVDRGGAVGDALVAVLVDVALVAVLGGVGLLLSRPHVQHRLALAVPPPSERTLLVFLAAATFAVLFAFWRPIEFVIWSLAPPVSSAVSGVGLLGWTIVVIGTLMLGHFELVGLRAAWSVFRRRRPRACRLRRLRGVDRHPLMLGILVAIWAAPTMTASRLVLAIASTSCIVIALIFEERDHVARQGIVDGDHRHPVPRRSAFLRQARKM